MRIAHLIDGFGGMGGGIATYLRALLLALEARGIENVIVAGQPETDAPAGVPYLHAPGIDGDGTRLSSPDRAALDRALRDARPDVCYVHVILAEAVEVAARHAPVVLYAHEYLTVCPGGMRYLQRSERFCAEGPGLRCFWRAYTERTTNRRPDRLGEAYARVRAWRSLWDAVARVIVASPFVAGVLAADGAPRARTAVVPYPVLPPSRPPRAGLGDGVLYLGRLVPSKGVHVLLTALARLPDATLTIAGAGPGRARLERLARRLDLGDRVRFTGWVAPIERDELFARVRVLAIPSLWEEPFGIVGLEALSHGVPVVASAVGGIPSWLTDGGELVSARDADALADALGRILTDDQLAARLAAAGPRVAERFSMERHLDLLLAELAAAQPAADASSSAARA